jgi:hypothetical protein
MYSEVSECAPTNLRGTYETKNHSEEFTVELFIVEVLHS